MSYFLVFLAVALLGAIAWLVTGSRTNGTANYILDEALGEPVANLPPVLLPDEVQPGDVERIRFSLGLRGYRMDQVDQVLDRLRHQLTLRDAEIARLQQLAATRETTAGEHP